jgi:SAM-dependent methyltransferase
MKRLRHRLKAAWWKRRGSVPHGAGATAARWIAIERSFAEPARYGADDAGVDERVVEYAWLFDRMRSLKANGGRVLDAGSVLNYRPVIDAWRAAQFPPVSVVTLAYEGHAYPSTHTSYEFADLRMLPYRDEWFSTVTCLSTIEHVGLDNRIYGAAAEGTSDPTREAVRALQELQRVLKRGGTLLLSVPFGRSANRGWFRILDSRDLEPLVSAPGWEGHRVRYFRAERSGWREVDAGQAEVAGYNEPPGRPGQRTAPEWVAGAEAVALVEMRRT